MAHKIKNFKEYDRLRSERELNREQLVESRLEVLINSDHLIREIREDTHRNRQRVKKVSYVLILGKVVELNTTELLQEINEAEADLIKACRQVIYPDLKKDAQLDCLISFVRENIDLLTVCGVNISKSYEGIIQMEDKQGLYRRVVDEIKNLAVEIPNFNYTFPYIEKLSAVLPLEKEDFHNFKKLLGSLAQHKFMRKENAQTLYDLLTKSQQILSGPKSVASFPRITPPGRKALPTAPDHSDTIEYLTFIFGVDENAAKQYAAVITVTQADEMYRELTRVMGERYTIQLIQQNPDILTYPADHKWSKYVTTIQLIQARIEKNGSPQDLQKKYGMESKFESYTSLEKLLELKRELFGETGNYDADEPHTKLSSQNLQRKDLSRYQFLHRGIPEVEQRLDSLVTSGQVTVTYNDHWNGANSGARGTHILEKMGHELTNLFAQQKLDSPSYNINYGQFTLTIDEPTRQALHNLRTQAYELQRKK